MCSGGVVCGPYYVAAMAYFGFERSSKNVTAVQLFQNIWSWTWENVICYLQLASTILQNFRACSMTLWLLRLLGNSYRTIKVLCSSPVCFVDITWRKCCMGIMGWIQKSPQLIESRSLFHIWGGTLPKRPHLRKIAWILAGTRVTSQSKFSFPEKFNYGR